MGLICFVLLDRGSLHDPLLPKCDPASRFASSTVMHLAISQFLAALLLDRQSASVRNRQRDGRGMGAGDDGVRVGRCGGRCVRVVSGKYVASAGWRSDGHVYR